MDNKENSLKDVAWVGVALSVLIALPTLALPTALITTLKTITEGEPDYGLMAQVAYRTMPLTAAVLVFMLGWLRQWFSPGWPLLIFGAVLLGVSTLLFHPQGFSVASKAVEESTGGNIFINYILQLLRFYYREYSFWDFLCSVLVGAFGGWALHRVWTNLPRR